MNRKHIAKRKGVICVLALLAMILIAITPAAASAPANPRGLTVWQVFTTTSDLADGTFSYRLRPLDPESPMPSGSTADGYTLTITGDAGVKINLPDYSRQGVYRYELSQVIITEKPGYTYDRRVYTIDVHIDDALEISAIIIFNRDGTKVQDIEYINSYRHSPNPWIPPSTEPPTPAKPVTPPPTPSDTPPSPVVTPTDIPPSPVTPSGDPLTDLDDDGVPRKWFDPSDPLLMVDPPLKKTVSGSPDHDSTFTFKLEASDSSQPMPSGSLNGVKTITITGSGEGEFGTWSYEREGAYYYTVTEVNTGEAGYAYDPAVYTITDMVKGEDGTLVVSRTVTNATNKTVSSFTFINRYGSDGPKTGDDMVTIFYIVLLSLGGAAVLGAAMTLIIGGKRKQ
jgi:pilin isopeptide linkage protein